MVQGMTKENGRWVVVRAESAGHFFGKLVGISPGSGCSYAAVQLEDARRLWRWDGAASLSEVAKRGVSRPEGCKFPPPTNVTVMGVIEIIDATPEAVRSIAAVPEWTEH